MIGRPVPRVIPGQAPEISRTRYFYPALCQESSQQSCRRQLPRLPDPQCLWRLLWLCIKNSNPADRKFHFGPLFRQGQWLKLSEDWKGPTMNLLMKICAYFSALAPAALLGATQPGYQRQTGDAGSGYQIRAKRRRQRLDAGQFRAGADDDRSRTGPVLRRPGAAQERARHHDAQLHPDGRSDGALGGGRLQPGVRRIFALYRRPSVRVPERRGQRAQCRLRRHHPAADLHGLPVDVRHHHAGADLRRVRRAHEVQRDAAVHGAVDADRLLPDGAHGVGQGRIAECVLWAARFPASISRAAPWCTSPRGVSALVCALYLGKRVGYPQRTP